MYRWLRVSSGRPYRRTIFRGGATADAAEANNDLSSSSGWRGRDRAPGTDFQAEA
jgi:hypothetical protein